MPFSRIPQTQKAGSLTRPTSSSVPSFSSSKSIASSGTIRKPSGPVGYPTATTSPTTTMREIRTLGSGTTPGQLARQTANARVVPQQKSAPKATVLRPSAPAVKHPVLKKPASVVTKVPATGNLVFESVLAPGKAVFASMPAASNGVHRSKDFEPVALGDPLLLGRVVAQPELVAVQNLPVQKPVTIESTACQQITLSDPLPAAQLPSLLAEPVVVSSAIGSPVKEPAIEESRSELWSTMHSLLQTFESKLDGPGKCCTDPELVPDMKRMLAGLQDKSSRLAKRPTGKLDLSYAAEGKLKLQYQEAQQEALLASTETSQAPYRPEAKDHGSGCYAGCRRLLSWQAGMET